MDTDTAKKALAAYVRDEWRTRAARGEKITRPQVGLLDIDLTTNAIVQSVGGPVTPPTRAQFHRCGFIDDLPNANWEHACRYAFIDADGKVETVKSTVPPSQKGNQIMIDITAEIFGDRTP